MMIFILTPLFLFVFSRQNRDRMTTYLANFCKFGQSYTSYVESKPLAVATHSKGFEWLDHSLHPTKDYPTCTFYADTIYILRTVLLYQEIYLYAKRYINISVYYIIMIFILSTLFLCVTLWT